MNDGLRPTGPPLRAAHTATESWLHVRRRADARPRHRRQHRGLQRCERGSAAPLTIRRARSALYVGRAKSPRRTAASVVPHVSRLADAELGVLGALLRTWRGRAPRWRRWCPNYRRIFSVQRLLCRTRRNSALRAAIHTG